PAGPATTTPTRQRRRAYHPAGRAGRGHRDGAAPRGAVVRVRQTPPPRGGQPPLATPGRVASSAAHRPPPQARHENRLMRNPHLTPPQVIFVGLLQGVTELFPVSSLGHGVRSPCSAAARGPGI